MEDARDGSVSSTKLYTLFRTLQGRQVVFVEPGGNHGDRLIYRGAEKLGRAAGLGFQVLTYREFMQFPLSGVGVVFIHGGGGCVPLYSGTPISALRRALREHAGTTILGPQTFWKEARYLARIFEGIARPRSERVVLFTRELTSYVALREHAPVWAEVEHDHDTALNLTAGDLGHPVSSSIASRREHLLIMRRDHEAPRGMVAPEHAVDPVFDCPTLQGWVELHGRAASIVTNRLHSAIVAVILGIPATLMPNGYFKNRAVWEYSLEARGVSWSEGVPDTPAEARRVLISARGRYSSLSTVRSAPGARRVRITLRTKGTARVAVVNRGRPGPGSGSLADTLVFLAADRAYIPWATLFLRSLAQQHGEVRASIHGVNLEAADLAALAGCPGSITVTNERVALEGRRLAEYVANHRPIWFRALVRQEEARWYLLADADLLVRRPLDGLRELANDHDAALVFRPGVWRGREWAKLRVAAGLVLVGRSAGPLLDEWVACLHSGRPIEDVQPWAWFWEQACLYVATTRVPLRYASIPAGEYLDSHPFKNGSAIWSANIPTEMKPLVYRRFARELRRIRGRGEGGTSTGRSVGREGGKYHLP